MTKSWKKKNEELAVFWRVHIEQWSESGLTQTEYCRRNEISRDQFTYWKIKFRKQVQPKEIIQIPLPVHIGSHGLRLNIGRSLQIEIPDNFNRTTLEQVLLTLKVLS